MISKIDLCRDIALAVLKPSKRDLEHGLELHRNALVWDAYSFAPSGAIPAEYAATLAQECLDCDERTNLLEQYRQVDFLEDPDMRTEYQAAWQASGVDCVFQNAGVEGNAIPQLIKRLSRFTWLPDRYPELYQRVAFPDQVVAARQAGRRCLYLCTNGVPLPGDQYSVEETLYFLTVFRQLGVRMMHLTYNRRNLLGDGCAESADAGLSDLGRRVIAEMNRVGIIPDVAHSGQRTSLEAAECSSKPVVASHSVAGALSTHFRAKKPDVIRAIVKSGGYVGVCAISAFFRGTGKIDSFLDHIDHLAENYGYDHVAIGTDCGHLCGESKATTRMPKSRAILEQYWPPAQDPFPTTEEMAASVAWTNWPLFTVGLVQRGHRDDDIRKIIGGNVLRVTQATLA